MKDVWLDHRGALRALASDGTTLFFVTEHPEGHPTGRYALDPDKGTLATHAGPGATHLAGTDQPTSGPTALLFKGVATTDGNELTLGKKTFELPAPATALCADTTGRWVVAGCSDGSIAVFHAEKTAFTALATGKLHNGAVTALVFDPRETRFWSAGADNVLQSTHARGELEPLDRSGKNGHDKPVRALVCHGDLLFSAGDDGHLKVWDRTSRKRPSTVKNAGKAVGLAVVSVDGQDHVALATETKIRLFPLEKGKPDAATRTFHGAVAKVRRELDGDATRKAAALKTLASWDDAAAIELISGIASNDSDIKLRSQAVELLGASDNARAIPPLVSLLRDSVASIRLAAFRGLTTAHDQDLAPLRLALEARHADIGVLAVERLAARADDTSRALLLDTLNHREEAVRTAVLHALETVYPGAEATRLAVASSHADTRRLAAIRLLQRDLLADPVAQRVLGALTEDADASVRHAAYPLRILAWPLLAGHLRALDADFHRTVHGLETFGQDKPKKAAKAKRPTKPPETVSPLVRAASSRQPDTSCRGATHLALLGDPKAFGVLLQLSRHDTVDIRGRAARALAQLADERALSRLRALLRDPDRSVRDAAFSALAKILAKRPLEAVEAGFVAPETDVRTRALALLVKTLKKPSKKARELLVTALNDATAKLRGDAFKAALSLDDAETALAGILERAQHADVQRLALTEIMAEIRHPWAYELLLRVFDDPDAGVRSEALAFARKKCRGRTPSAIGRALTSIFADLRYEAVCVLAKKVDADAITHLITALADEDARVRTTALTALQRADAREAIGAALDSPHADVRIGAAATLASHRDSRALQPLLDQIASVEPEIGDLKKLWVAHGKVALDGLATLGDPAASEPVAALLSHDDLGEAAAHALPWVADDAVLRANLRGKHTRPLALGLAWRGHADGAWFVFDGKTPALDVTTAALSLGDDERLLAQLHDKQAALNALRLLALSAWVDPAVPERLLNALTAPHGTTRLAVVGLLASWHDAEALTAAVRDTIGAKNLPVDDALLRRLAAAVRHGEGMARVAMVRVLPLFDQRWTSSQQGAELAARIEHAVGLVFQRFPDLAATVDAAPATDAKEAVDLQPIVYGTLVALAGQVERRSTSVRSAALRRLGALATGEDLVDAVLPAFRDPSAAVRQQAFEVLATHDGIAEEALATGHRDLGILALRQLAEAGGDAVLIDVLSQRVDSLARVAWYQLRQGKTGLEGVEQALDARNASVRELAVSTLDEHWVTDPGPLRAALKSAHPNVHREAAFALGHRQDPASRDALLALLRTSEHADEALEALVETNDVTVAQALVERIVDDPRGTAEVSDLLDAIGDLRQPAVAESLVPLLTSHKRHAGEVISALLTISGYDQRIAWRPDRPDADDSWMRDQHPRHDEVLALALDAMAARNDTRGLRRQWIGSAWARSATDAPLLRMFDHADAAIRQGATEAYGWRVRYRDADPEPLRRLLAHQDGATSFLAAEALARAGQADGISVLLASVDTLPDLDSRHRAVLALGLLADERALDPLMAIAADKEHALVESAAEALGHLSEHADADSVQARILDLSKHDGNIGRRALMGLRHFGSATAWARIREVAAGDDPWKQRAAAELLTYDPEDPAALLTRLLEEGDWAVQRAAKTAWRDRVGPDSLEPDYVLARVGYLMEDDTLERLRANGEPARLLELVADPRCDENVAGALLLTLMEAKLPSKDVLAALASPLERSVVAAARLLGRKAKLTAGEKKALTARASDVRTPPSTEGLTAYALTPLWWAAAKHGITEPLLANLGHPDADVRRAAMAAARVADDDAVAAAVVSTGSGRERSLAARALPTSSIDQLLDDPAAADALVAKGAQVPAEAASTAHQQGVVAPHLVRSAATAPLADAMASSEQAVRMGAIEALGAMGTEAGEKLLVGFATNEEHEEEERKLAWRCLRRSKRIRGSRS